MRLAFGVIAVSLMVLAAPACAQDFKYTYDGASHDAVFRSVAQALFADQARAAVTVSSACDMRAAGGNKKAEDAFRKANGVAPGTQLYYASCEAVLREVCHRSFYSGKDKCSAGDADVFFETISLNQSPEQAASRVLVAYFMKKGRAAGRIAQVFYYDYSLMKTEAGWLVTGKKFVKMSDL